MMSEAAVNAMLRAFVSAVELDASTKHGNANVVDGLFALARAIDRRAAASEKAVEFHDHTLNVLTDKRKGTQ